ncbi:hypothetical protein MASR2M74_26340 [Paracoccaceae bacterium]
MSIRDDMSRIRGAETEKNLKVPVLMHWNRDQRAAPVRQQHLLDRILDCFATCSPYAWPSVESSCEQIIWNAQIWPPVRSWRIDVKRVSAFERPLTGILKKCRSIDPGIMAQPAQNALNGCILITIRPPHEALNDFNKLDIRRHPYLPHR